MTDKTTLYGEFSLLAKAHPEYVCCKYFDKCFEYGDMLGKVDTLADYLLSICKDKNIGIIMPNCPDMLTAMYAVNKIGKTAVFLNPKSPVAELKRACSLCEIKLIIASDIAFAKLETMITDGFDIDVIGSSLLDDMPLFFVPSILKKKKNSTSRIKKALTRNGKKLVFIKDICKKTPSSHVDSRYTDEAVIIFSGGTGGTLKYIVHSSEGIISSCRDCRKLLTKLKPESAMLAVLPCFHIFGLIVGIILPVVLEGYPVLYPFFHAKTIGKLMANNCPEYICAVPTIFEKIKNIGILDRYEKSGRLNVKSFEWGFCGGDVVDPEVLSYYNDLFMRNGSSGFISVGYGMSECCPISVCEKGVYEPMYVGIIQSMTSVKILDEENHEVEDGELGEIVISSDYLMLRTKDENNQEIIPDGCYHTRDIGYKIGNRLYYKTRMRRIIKTSGHSIFAEEIENLLKTHPAVANAYVVPVASEKRGFVPYAYIILKDRSSVRDEAVLFRELGDIVRSNMVAYGIPCGYEICEEKDIEKTMLGKVVYGKLENNMWHKD